MRLRLGADSTSILFHSLAFSPMRYRARSHEPSPVSIDIDGTPCESATWESQGELQCELERELMMGPKGHRVGRFESGSAPLALSVAGVTLNGSQIAAGLKMDCGSGSFRAPGSSSRQDPAMCPAAVLLELCALHAFVNTHQYLRTRVTDLSCYPRGTG